MLLRLAGALAVITGCVGLGFYHAAKENFRTGELLEFKKALFILASEIGYTRSPLAIACENIARRTTAVVGEMFANFSSALASSEGETAYQLWINAMDAVRQKSFMATEDWDIIEGFGKTLGYLDKTMQQNAIEYAITYINDKTITLKTQGAKNKRMYQSLGIIGGLLVTVVLW